MYRTIVIIGITMIAVSWPRAGETREFQGKNSRITITAINLSTYFRYTLRFAALPIMADDASSLFASRSTRGGKRLGGSSSAESQQLLHGDAWDVLKICSIYRTHRAADSWKSKSRRDAARHLAT